MKELILNADDFGYTRGINAAILRAHREGVLTSATLMANGPAFDDAVESARACPELGVGCHFVLVGGHSVAKPHEIPSLAKPDGRLPESLAVFVARVSSGSIKTEDIAAELRAQVAKIRRAGIEPSHIDSHKHTYAHPKVFGVVARTAQELAIRNVRNPFERLGDSWASARRGRALGIQLVASAAARLSSRQFFNTLKKYDLLTPDHFLGLAVTGHLGPAELRETVRTLPEGTTEVMLHPGYCDADLEATGTRLKMERENELQALLDPEVKRLIEEGNIRRITFRDLR
ncbi:MAG TPA: ChbG/HpnK family deacetylase [Verrucomicrobiae bacterium]|nr:ChbG/HpnK family deacetylase [Verrucomicrobiae bacterium]